MGKCAAAQQAPQGGVVEWLMAPVLKTGDPKGSVGSNPTPSVFTGSERSAEIPKSLQCSRSALLGRPGRSAESPLQRLRSGAVRHGQ
jgi:hypothetical protein